MLIVGNYVINVEDERTGDLEEEKGPLICPVSRRER